MLLINERELRQATLLLGVNFLLQMVPQIPVSPEGLYHNLINKWLMPLSFTPPSALCDQLIAKIL